jgi:hypothetical protein
LLPIFINYIKNGTLTPDDLKPMEVQLRQLIPAVSDQLVENLQGEYKKYSPFVPIEDKLMNLCNDLVKKIVEIARRS